MQAVRLTINSAAAGASFDGYLPAEGERFVTAIKVRIAQCALTPTVTLNVYDLEGDLLYSKAGIAENAVTMIYPARTDSKDVPLRAGARIGLVFTTAPGVATHTLVFYLNDRA